MSDTSLTTKSSAGAGRVPAFAAGGMGSAVAVLGYVLGSAGLTILGLAVALLLGGGLFLRHLMRTNPQMAAIEQHERAQAAEAQDRERYGELRRRFLQVRAPAVHAEAGRAFKQLEAAQALWRAFGSGLARKFQPSEMTHARYNGTAEQVFLGVIANLNVLADKLGALESLSSTGATASGDDDLKKGVALMLAENDKALTSLAQVNAALADVRTDRGELKVGLDASMVELEVLAQRAHLYSNDR